MTNPKAAEFHALAIGAWMESHPVATTEQIMTGTGLTKYQISKGLQEFRRATGPVLGISIVWNSHTGVFEFVDVLGDYLRPETIAGYESSTWKRIASFSMTAVQLSRTAYHRAVIDGDTLAIAIYRKRTKAFSDSLETFSAEAAYIGNVSEVERIEEFLASVV